MMKFLQHLYKQDSINHNNYSHSHSGRNICNSSKSNIVRKEIPERDHRANLLQGRVSNEEIFSPKLDCKSRNLSKNLSFDNRISGSIYISSENKIVKSIIEQVEIRNINLHPKLEVS